MNFLIHVTVRRAYGKSFEFAINQWDGCDFDPRISINPKYFYEIPEVTINNVEFLFKEISGNFMEINLLDDLKKINDYSAKIGESIKEGLLLAFNILSYFSENHNEFVKGWKNDLDSRGKINDLDSRGKINNLTDPHLNFIDESFENCKKIADRFSEFHEFLNSGIMKLEESLRKIENKSDKKIYEQTLEKKKNIDEWHQKSNEIFNFTN
ncbi:1063_t:CDS:2 [Acaulospora morrowiae]|uniref:1063_t:CDS:1 n=1 Tax=Acaulospora morrowiae TaxID=94023 RepID=A0A9N8ZE66_9GLOM|nr:1063_t:CDS:2 [Acaulospora morrowiae]